MASRNFNFLQSYGTSVIHIPFKFRVVNVPTRRIVEQFPADGFSVVADLLGLGSIRVRMVDNFSEFLGIQLTWFDDQGIDSYLKLDGIQFAPEARQIFILKTYVLDANAQQMDVDAVGDVYGLITMRNSSVKF